MKMNNISKIKNRILNFLKQPLIYIVVICILYQIKTYNELPEYKSTDDTLGYINASKQINIFEGKIDRSRVPVYPYFIKIIRRIGGEERLINNIAMAQKCLFIITLILFYFSINTFTKNKLILSIITLIFGTSPFIIFWNVLVLTEALSIAEMVLLSLLTLKYFKKPNSILAVSMRNSYINYDYDKTSFYLFSSNLCIILDFKMVF